MIGVVAKIRAGFRMLRRTPLHPQWLLGSKNQTGLWVRQHASGLVLDIGCADRWLTSYLSSATDYIALDYPVTGGFLYSAQPDIFADAARLPLASASVDTVLLLEVLEHLQHPARALSEIARVLRPGGKLLLSLPFLYPVHDAPHDYQRYTCHGLVRELEAAGLSTEVPSPNLGSAESAGLIFNLALGGMASKAIAGKKPSILLLPLVAIAIPVLNIASWLLGKVLPEWPALTAGYRVVAFRP